MAAGTLTVEEDSLIAEEDNFIVVVEEAVSMGMDQGLEEAVSMEMVRGSDLEEPGDHSIVDTDSHCITLTSYYITHGHVIIPPLILLLRCVTMAWCNP